VISTNFEVINEFNPSLLRALNESRLKPDMARAVNRIMATWVGFAMNKMYSAQKAEIKSRLEGRATRAKFEVATGKGPIKRGRGGAESKNARYQLLKNSLAAYIVWSQNYTGKLGSKKKGYRSVTARPASAQDFYALVGKYIAARQYSAGYLRSGMRPALNTFRVRLGLVARDAKYRKPVSTGGEVGRAKKAEPDERIPTAEVENWATGILEKFPNAFTDSLPEMEAQVQRWIVENLAERAREQGIAATYRA